jgi:hypothetical protein
LLVIHLSAKGGQAGAGALVFRSLELEHQMAKDALNLALVIIGVWRKQEVDVDPLAPGRLRIQTHFHVGEDKPHVGEPALGLELPHLFVRLDREVVRNAEGANRGGCALDSREIPLPVPREPILLRSPRRVNVRIPAMPFRTARIPQGGGFHDSLNAKSAASGFERSILTDPRRVGHRPRPFPTDGWEAKRFAHGSPWN